MERAEAGSAFLVSSSLEAEWLAELSLGTSQASKANEPEAAIMRLSARPELLHCLLNCGVQQALPPARSVMRVDALLKFAGSGSVGRRVNRCPSRIDFYLCPPVDQDRATSLVPRVFVPTDEDVSVAIACEDVASPRRDHIAWSTAFLIAVAALCLAGIPVGYLLLA